MRHTKLFSTVGHATIAASALVIILALAEPAAAQVSPGVRAGVSATPDQFYFGVHFDAPLVDRLAFRPNIEVGFGDDTTLFAINPEFIYRFPHRRSPWGVYAGGGPAINIYRFSNDGSETEAGLNVLAGLEYRRGLFFEAKLGAIDSPDFKFGIGYTWP